MLIQGFLYDPDFLNTSSILDPVLKSGGVCVLSSQSLSYFVTPQEFPDERPTRTPGLNAVMTNKARLVIDQEKFSSFLNDTTTVWTQVERQNLFSVFDRLCFAYVRGASRSLIESLLAVIPQYISNTFAYSETDTLSTVYNGSEGTAILCPDWVSFNYVISTGTQYQLKIWLNNTQFYNSYPLSTIRTVVPPLPLSVLYNLSITNSTASIFATALAAASTSQQNLQGPISLGQYSGYVAYDVPFVDGAGDSVQVQFNLLYNGCVPGGIAIKNAIRDFLLNSGVGTPSGWKSIAPSLFATELFYLLPLWDTTTELVSEIIYQNIIPVQRAINDATLALSDLPTEFVVNNLNIVTSFYNNITLVAVPDTGNDPSRFSLSLEHPTYQDVATTSPQFISMAQETQQFSSLLGSALSAAGGTTPTSPIPPINPLLSTYSLPNDTRSYVIFTVLDVTYYVMTKASYLAKVMGT